MTRPHGDRWRPSATPLMIAVTNLAAIAVTVAGAQMPPTTGAFGAAPVVTVPFEVVHDLVVIRARVNGYGPLRLILDTGAPAMLIPDTALARRAGIEAAGQAQVSGVGDGPPQLAPLALNVAVDLGGFAVQGALAVLGVGGAVIPGVDGVVGGPLFLHSVVEFDWDAAVVRFHDPARFRAAAGGEQLPLRVEPSLRAFLHGALPAAGGDSVVVELLLDTGARKALGLGRAAYSRLAPPVRAVRSDAVSWGTAGPARGLLARVPGLRLGALAVAPVVAASLDSDTGATGWIGVPLLRRYRVFVDFAGGRLILAPRRASDAPIADATTTGLVLAPARDSVPVVVADVFAGSPAFEAGLRAGDVIVAIGDAETRALTALLIDRRLLRPAPASSVRVTVLRGGARRTVTLMARVLL